MSRPPRNGYTINSDQELAFLDARSLPENTPLINFDRKCWGIYQAPVTFVPWTPSAIPTQLWLDAADNSTITTVSSAVSQWNDKSGNAWHCYQTDSSRRPSYVSNSINGLSSVRFNGSSFLRNTDKQFPLQTRAIYIVFKENVGINDAGVLVITPTSGNDYEQNNALVINAGYKNNFSSLFVGTTSSTYALITPDTINNKSPLGIYQELKTPSLGTLYLNGTSVYTDNSFTEFSALSGGGYLLGARYIYGNIYSSAGFLNGDILEILYLNYIPSTDIDKRIQGYLAHKWGIASSLPSDHPYKTNPPVSDTPITIPPDTPPSFEYIPQNDINSYNLTSLSTTTESTGGVVFTSYSVYRTETDGYYGSEVLSRINDGDFSTGMIANGNICSLVITLPSSNVLASFIIQNGQFNGHYNRPTSVSIYRGSTVDSSKLIGTYNVATYSLTEVSVDSSVASNVYLFVFSGSGTGQISIRELQLKVYENTIVNVDSLQIDLSTINQYCSISLTNNASLSIINPPKYTKYFIELIPNGYTIKNFTDIFALPKQYSLSTLLTAYFGKQVLELQYINKLYANIDYSDNVDKTGAVVTAQKINWASPSSEILYLAFGTSTTAYTGAGISAIAATVGTPSISKSRLLLGSTGRLEATKTSTLDFNETDFTISFFSAKTSLGEYGCILGSHKSSSVGFYVGIAADSTLYAIFGSNTLSCTFPDDLFEHSVIINRIGRVYKIFIDGVLSTYLQATDNFNNNSTEPLCIGSLKNATGTPSWTSQSWQGYLRQLTINKNASIPFSANDVPPKDALATSTVLLLKYNVSDADFAQYNLTRSFTSNTTVQPLIASGRLNKYSHIGYTNSNLEITGNVTLEAKIYNPIGNTRGAIIDVQGGFTWGIYDLKLRIAFGSFTLDGVTDIPDNTLVDVAFVKLGTTCFLFLNGELEATATTSEVMNTASSSSEFSIKRTYTQDSVVASLNTSLFRSRSWIEIAQLRVTKSARYTSDYIPDFSYGQ